MGAMRRLKMENKNSYPYKVPPSPLPKHGVSKSLLRKKYSNKVLKDLSSEERMQMIIDIAHQLMKEEEYEE